MSYKTKLKTIAAAAISAAVLAACGGGSSPETELVNNAQSAHSISSRIEALPTAENATANDVAAINQVIAAYNNLGSKSLVSKTAAEKLEALIKAIKTTELTAQAIQNQINALPDTGNEIDTAAEEAALDKAEKAYNALSANQKTWVAPAFAQKLTKLSNEVVLDNNPLAAINEPAPLPSAFLTLAVNKQSQQFNPQTQLRTTGEFLTNQPRLIKELAINGDTTAQDKIGLTAIGVKDLSELPNPDGKIKEMVKISAGARQEQPNGTKYNPVREVIYLPDAQSRYLDAKWSSVYAIRTTTGVDIVLRDPAEMGWNYQTFVHYINEDNKIGYGYQSIGTETPANAMPTSGTATYTGLSSAHYVVNGGWQQMTADVKAVADFGKKAVRFQTSNSQLHTAVGDVRSSKAAEQLNMKGHGSWSSGNQFTGTVQTANGLSGDLNGKFYGANAAEIGGTYGLQKGNEQLIGGYGAKRQ